MLRNISRSLADLLGEAYMRAVKAAAVEINGMEEAEAERLIHEKVDFYPESYVMRMDEMARRTGEQIIPPFDDALLGAPTDAFRRSTHTGMAPLGGIGCTRIGQDGRAYLIAKSEHYHASLGHNFPGYKLITNARRLGILNATHNNTRGYITRLCERRIIAAANGVQAEWDIEAVLASTQPQVLNRIINLETGSLAVEAGIKMMLSRFYKLDAQAASPRYEGKIPVFLIMEDNKEGFTANYHGTTIFAQTLRGMWSTFYDRCAENEIYKIVSVKKNDIADFADKIRIYNSGKYKTAGFLHEIILMNYSGIRLTPAYLQQAYALCHESDTLTLSDEIQSCMWYDGMFLFKKYGLTPDFVIIGKGFPGGEYAASKVITTAEADTLNQFGALVTNGQEELASLAYLITMEFSRANGDRIEEMGEKVEASLRGIAAEFPALLDAPEGLGHLSAIHFREGEKAAEFSALMGSMCVDMSAQLYKADCPPAVLLKLPLICDETVLEVVCDRVRQGLKALA